MFKEQFLTFLLVWCREIVIDNAWNEKYEVRKWKIPVQIHRPLEL